MQSIIRFALENRLLVVVLSLATLIGGYFAYRTLPVDAYPDISPSLVQVFVETEGLAPEEVEKYVTYPVESAMNGLPKLDHVRSVSNFGLSVVNIYFEDGTDIYFARQLVGERLQVARESIPDGFGEPVMGPITTGLGQILFYVLEDTSGEYNNTQLREIQDWIVKFNLQTVKGVTEVLSIGGEVKQFQVRVDPDALIRYDVSLPQIKERIEENNANAGAQFIVKNDEEYIVRSVGLATDLASLRNIVVKTIDGTPVYLEQLGELKIGGEIRRGLTTKDGNGEVVVGMVLKLIGSNTSEVINAVKKELATINDNLPKGIEVQPYYDQATLVKAAVSTVINALLQGIILVALVLLAFMGGLRPSLVVALSIPFSVGFTFLAMKFFGISANLMSLGGIAIAIGMMVDGAVVVVENVDRMLRESSPDESRLHIVARACQAVARPILFAISIIIIVFLPLFTLQGVEGATFRPLAYTVAVAMLGSLIFALVVAPVTSLLLMKRPQKQDDKPRKDIISFLMKGYQPMVQLMVARRWIAVTVAGVVLAVGIAVAPFLGSEFVPRLNEGDLLIRATMAPSISLEKAEDTITVFERQLKKAFPEVTQVVSRIGRGEVGAHADPVNNAEIFVSLKPQEEWVSAESLDGLYAAMSKKFENFPGAKFNFTQPIAAAVDELLTGTKAELAAKLFGDDLDVLAKQAQAIEQVMRTVPGAQDVQRDQIGGTPQLRITLNRNAIARYGLNVSDVQKTLSVAVGGSEAGQVFEGIRRFDIYVRLEKKSRDEADVIRQLIIENDAGQRIPLEELANIEEVVGPRQITRENNQRFITIQTNVRERDIGSFVAEADAAIAEQVDLPPGYFLKWGGQFELQQQANKRLMIVVPITLGLVFLMLYANFNSLRNALLIMLNIPLALVGGIVGLWLSGQSLSVPASVGFIALFGIALENGLVLVSYLNELVRDGVPVAEASVRAACSRLRAVIMTAVTTALGLFPLLFASGTGSEVQRPLATVVVGGLVTATLLTLLVLPALYQWFADKPADIGASH
ncbi:MULTISPECIES: efflux RND transporter permease subunit [Alcanivorax]|jgi:cobalt-zinc-cadmium resistance protein CzcA|uniref:efflux RND transporter permease subunit n=1 Tax=Alcanivorax TaxID=59753 RepID=UPI002353CAAD|nr:MULTISPECIES: CusA/CzcA family heavy metal efflux RND transporter [Alcanivorax]|tara:strand:+ start:15744 stop:18845 length:3102 start_codon:yes stop_codon:yes gene_type:complete